MGRLPLGIALSTLMVLAGGESAADVKLVYIGEISGSIAVSGGNFRDGKNCECLPRVSGNHPSQQPPPEQ